MGVTRASSEAYDASYEKDYLWGKYGATPIIEAI